MGQNRRPRRILVDLPFIIKKKDIWSILVRDVVGHEQRGEHPAVIIALHSSTQLAIVVPLTSNLEANRFSYTWHINRSPSNNLRCNSIAMIFQLKSIDYMRFIDKIGVIDSDDFEKIMILIKTYLGV